MANAIRLSVGVVLSWLLVAGGTFATIQLASLALTGEPPAFCGTVMTDFGFGFSLAGQLSTTLAGATLLAGAYWALAPRSRAARLVLLAIVLVAATFGLGLGGALAPMCTGGSPQLL